MKTILPLLLFSVFIVGSPPAFGQDSFPGFEGVAWGSDATTVSNKLLSAGQDRKYKGEGTPDAVTWNKTPLAKLAQFELGPPTMAQVYIGKYNERIECYFSNNKLGMILYSPTGQMMFSPDRIIKAVDDVYATAAPKKIRRDVPMLIDWGRVDPKMEYMQTFEWDNDEGVVRLFCKTWPVDDKRQVFRVVYTSKVISKRSPQLIAAEDARIAAEKKAREDERARKVAETQRKRAEAQADAAAKRDAGKNP